MFVPFSTWVVVSLFAPLAQSAEKPVTPGDIPEAVQVGVKARYPDFTLEGASSEREDGRVLFELRLVSADRKVSVEYVADGTFVEEEEALALDALPSSVKTALSEHYAGLTPVSVVRSSANEKNVWEIMLTRRGRCVELSFDDAGLLVSRESVPGCKQD
jgi:hypothetical protein